MFCSSEDQAKLAARKYARIVQKLGFPVSTTYIYSNIVCLCYKLIGPLWSVLYQQVHTPRVVLSPTMAPERAQCIVSTGSHAKCGSVPNNGTRPHQMYCINRFTSQMWFCPQQWHQNTPNVLYQQVHTPNVVLSTTMPPECAKCIVSTSSL